MTMHSPTITKVVLPFTESDLELAVAAKVREVEVWHEPLAVSVAIPSVRAHGGKVEKVETFKAVKPPSVKALV